MYAALRRFLFDIDLTSTVKFHNCPVNDAWQHLVSDIRRCGLGLRDSLYVRLVDVGAALEARTYQAPVDVVFEVEDTFCPWNEGRWRLSGDAKGASCAPTADAADLALPVRELGSASLGGVSLASPAEAARPMRGSRGGAHGFGKGRARGRKTPYPCGWCAGMPGMIPAVSYADSMSMRRT